MKLSRLIRFELKWMLKEPYSLIYILFPVLFIAIMWSGLLSKDFVSRFEYFYNIGYENAMFAITMQYEYFIWLILTLCMIAVSYKENPLYLCLPSGRLKLWTAKVISYLLISALHFICLSCSMLLMDIFNKGTLVASMVPVLMEFLTTGGLLVIFLALSAWLRHPIIFIFLALAVLCIPVFKPIVPYWISTYIVPPFFNFNFFPDYVRRFFIIGLPLYYIVFFLAGFVRFSRKPNL
jgi:hypothetical protein